MGARKHTRANQLKEERKTKYFARLRNCPTSPQKMRLVADLIRGIDVYKALNILKFNPREASGRLEKLLTSALSNYEAKTGVKPENGQLIVKEIFVDGARQLKRIKTAPQGRAHRVRKRSNHVTLVIDTHTTQQEEQKQA